MGAFRFRKEERLSRKKTIDSLFDKGASFTISPLKIIFAPAEDGHGTSQVLITVPSRNFKKAVDRNTLKRRIREAYRLNKSVLAASMRLCIAYIYIAREILPSAVIHKAVRSSLERLNTYEKKN